MDYNNTILRESGVPAYAACRTGGTGNSPELWKHRPHLRRHRLRVAGVLGTQYQRTAEEREIHRLLKAESGLPVFRTLIRMSPPVPRSIAARESILTFSPHCGASKDYRAFVREYLESF